MVFDVCKIFNSCITLAAAILDNGMLHCEVRAPDFTRPLTGKRIHTRVQTALDLLTGPSSPRRLALRKPIFLLYVCGISLPAVLQMDC